MASQNIFTTLAPGTQLEIAQKLFDRFKSCTRCYGWADPKDRIFDEEKNKWKYKPGSILTKRGTVTVEMWLSHLRGEFALGLAPTLDDGTAYWGCIDVDIYDMDITEIIRNVKARFPMVEAIRSKSGGLHLFIFFKTPIDCLRLQQGLKSWAAHLGLAASEVFPKQVRLAPEQDGALWLFMPYGTPEECLVGETGGDMTAAEYVEIYENRFAELDVFTNVKSEKTNVVGFPNKKRSSGRWSQDTATIEETFRQGPPCLYDIAQKGVPDNKHNFLIECSTFLKRKYPENWDEALRWINVIVLMPAGNPEKLEDIIKTTRGREYFYGCKKEPICDYCDSVVCRNRKYGVGDDQHNPAQMDLALAIVNTDPKIYFVGEARMKLDAKELLDQKKFRERCLEHGQPFPDKISQHDWDELLRRSITEAVVLEPTELYKKDANELMVLQRYFRATIPVWVRSRGDEFLSGAVGEAVRIKLKEEKIYFKWEQLMLWCTRALNMGDKSIEKVRGWLDKNGEWHGRDKLRDWYRSSWSVRFKQIDAGVLDRCLNPDAPEESEELDENTDK